jgi:hypothetical protein
VTAAKAEKVALEVAASAVAPVIGSEGKAIELGLAAGNSDELGHDHGWEVGEGSRRGRHRNAVAARGLGLGEG